MLCRPGCGACCIAPSISSLQKPADQPCLYLDADQRCGLWGDPRRPAVCHSLQPSPEMCGTSREQALATLALWERLTRPENSPIMGTPES